MSNPNILNLSSIVGKANGVTLGTTNTLVIDNTVSSNTVAKVNVMYVTNSSNTNTATVSLYYFSNTNMGGTGIPFVRNLSVPAQATIVVIDKESTFYIEENRSIGGFSNAASLLSVLISYELITN